MLDAEGGQALPPKHSRNDLEADKIWAEAAGEMARRLINIIAVGIVGAAIAFGMAAVEVIL
jgi:hypothetical protein